jgi:predicted nucleotidyltransferase component of viral defense system
MMLRNPYGVDLGTSGLILRAQSREEILADKIVALAFRENRIKNRDLWDIGWLVQQGVELPVALIPLKVRDYRRAEEEFVGLLRDRLSTLRTEAVVRTDFIKEMRRFLPAATIRETIEKPAYWEYLIQVVDDQVKRAVAGLK